MNKENYLIHNLKINAIFRFFISWWVFSDSYGSKTVLRNMLTDNEKKIWWRLEGVKF